jgi:hypothetical protein
LSSDVFIELKFRLFVYVALIRSRDSSVAVETGWKLDGRLSNSVRGKIFLFFKMTTPGLGPTQPIIEWVLGVLSTALKRPGI